jgi:hypothetical protein
VLVYDMRRRIHASQAAFSNWRRRRREGDSPKIQGCR